MTKNESSNQQAVVDLRVLAALSLFASKDDTRYYLQGVCIEVEERAVTYIGTDGSRLLVYREDLAPDEESHSLEGAFIVPTPHCKHFKLDKDDDGRATLRPADAGRLTLAHGFMDVTFLPIDGVYPHWRRSLPRVAASGVPAQFSIKLLSDLGKICKQLELGPPFIAHNGEAPAFVWFSGRPNVLGLLAPLKMVDETEREAPQWARRVPDWQQADIEDLIISSEEEFDPETGELTPCHEAADEQQARP